MYNRIRDRRRYHTLEKNLNHASRTVVRFTIRVWGVVSSLYVVIQS